MCKCAGFFNVFYLYFIMIAFSPFVLLLFILLWKAFWDAWMQEKCYIHKFEFENTMILRMKCGKLVRMLQIICIFITD